MSRKPYIRKISTTSWWLKRPAYTRYMIREFSSFFVGGYAAVLMIGVRRLAQGREAYDAFLVSLQSPLALTFHAVGLLFALYHTVTFFGASDKALPMQIGAEKVPGKLIVAGHYAAMVALSAFILVLALWR